MNDSILFFKDTRAYREPLIDTKVEFEPGIEYEIEARAFDPPESRSVLISTDYEGHAAEIIVTINQLKKIVENWEERWGDTKNLHS